MIDASRLVAPREHLGVLIEPPASRWGDVIQRAGPAADVRILGIPAAELRAGLRRRLGLAGPLVVTGHQAEFFHAGVLAKTIAARHHAGMQRGTALFVTVDSDVAKSEQLRVPQVVGGGVRRVDVRIPGVDARTVVEHLPGVPRKHWLDFFARIAAVLPDYDHSALRTFADGWLADADDAASFTSRLERGNGAVEGWLGAADVPVTRVSTLSRTPEFVALVAHLILHAAEFAAAYNASQAEYRRRRRIRNPQRPVPPLAVGPERIELPLWVLRPGDARRRLYVRQVADAFELSGDGEAIGVVAGQQLRNARIGDDLLPGALATVLRPRALLLSWFLRMCVADLLIHGIGGARYDAMTDDFSRRFFGAAPPPLVCVSATLRLPLPQFGAAAGRLADARRRARDVRYNPQRYVRNAPAELLAERVAYIRESDALREARSTDRPARRRALLAIHDANARILAVDGWRAAELDQELQSLEAGRALDLVALDREYFHALHPLAALAALAERLRAALT